MHSSVEYGSKSKERKEPVQDTDNVEMPVCQYKYFNYSFYSPVFFPLL